MLTRCSAAIPRTARPSLSGAARCFSQRPSRFANSKKVRPQVLEKEREPAQSSLFTQQQQQWKEEQQQSLQQHQSSAFPSHADQREQAPEEMYTTQWDAARASGAVAHMRKVYGTMALGIGIASGTSIMTMASGLAVSPLIPGLASIVPLMGLMYTSKHTHSTVLRSGMFAAFTGLSGMAVAPLIQMALHVSPIIVPQALLLTTGLFGTMTALSLIAKPGSQLRWGVPLGGGLLILMAAGIGGMFVPVTSAWYPLLHSVSTYGGLALFTAYVAYDTQKMISEFEMGEDDHLKHAVDLFIDFKAIFVRVLQILMLSRGDD